MQKTGQGLFWRRVGAYIVDSFIIAFLVITPFGSEFRIDAQPNNFSELLSIASQLWSVDFILMSLVISLLVLFYWSFLEFKFGQSVGKILFRLRVKSTRKGQVRWWQAVVRNVTKLSTILLVLDVMYMLVKRGSQRYVEVLSGTVVVEEMAQ